MKAEKKAGHEDNILYMTQADEYMSPGKYKYASTVNDSAYHNLDEYEDKISGLSKQVDTRKDPITDTHSRNTSVGTTGVDPAVIIVEIIGRGGSGITQGMNHGGTRIISSNVIMNVLTDSRKIILKSDAFPHGSFKSQMLMIASQNEPTLSCNRIVCE